MENQPPNSSKNKPADPLSFPKVGMMNKNPTPLLSRRDKAMSHSPASAPKAYTLKVPPAQTGSPQARTPGKGSVDFFNEEKKNRLAGDDLISRYNKPRNKLLYFGVWLGVLLFVSGIGYTSYWMLRETRLQGYVAAPGFTVVQVAVVRSFGPDIAALRNELVMARVPLRNDIKDLEDTITQIKADMAGRQEKVQLLQQEASGVDKEADSVRKDASTAAQHVWSRAGGNMDAEYDQKLKDLGDRLQERAKQLNINYQPNQEFQSPEVWVNAFRLALYNAPASINPKAQRDWAEQQLADWNNYVKSRDQQIAEIKSKVTEIQNTPKEKMSEMEARRSQLQNQISDTNVELDPLRQELKEKEEAYAKAINDEASLEEVFYPQLVEAAESKKLITLPVNEKAGSFSWRHIDHLPEFPAGNYLLWIKAVKDQEEYWAIVPFTLQDYSTVQLIIEEGALVPTSQLMKSS